MKQKVMDAMQSFSRALMGPVLFLPIAGMLQAISSVMSNTALVTEGGVVWTLGKFINGGVGAVIGNLGILFCVGIAMSLAKKRKADAAFLALVSYLVWLAANSRWLDVAGKRFVRHRSDHLPRLSRYRHGRISGHDPWRGGGAGPQPLHRHRV